MPFRNRYPHGHPSFRDFLIWTAGRSLRGIPRPPQNSLQPAPPAHILLRQKHTSPMCSWIGHSTVLFQFAGMNILTDPHFGLRTGPLNRGPKRWQPPGINLADIPALDVVLLSHNHYDHLHLETLRIFARQHQCVFLVPKGLRHWLTQRLPTARIHEMNWDETVTHKTLEITFVSVQHWSKRGLWDTNQSLWGGFVLRGAGYKLFFAGDLGYSEACKDIGQSYGPFDLAAIPIGAYAPRWFLHNQHLDPYEAVQVHMDIGARCSLGIHWGTFHGLTDEALDEPPRLLAQARKQAGLDPEAFFVLKHGESYLLKEHKKYTFQRDK